MVVREGEQTIPFSSHECSEFPSALLGMSNGPMLPTALKTHRSTGAHRKGLCGDRHGKQPAGQGLG